MKLSRSGFHFFSLSLVSVIVFVFFFLFVLFFLVFFYLHIRSILDGGEYFDIAGSNTLKTKVPGWYCFICSPDTRVVPLLKKCPSCGSKKSTTNKTVGVRDTLPFSRFIMRNFAVQLTHHQANEVHQAMVYSAKITTTKSPNWSPLVINLFARSKQKPWTRAQEFADVCMDICHQFDEQQFAKRLHH